MATDKDKFCEFEGLEGHWLCMKCGQSVPRIAGYMSPFAIPCKAQYRSIATQERPERASGAEARERCNYLDQIYDPQAILTEGVREQIQEAIASDILEVAKRIKPEPTALTFAIYEPNVGFIFRDDLDRRYVLTLEGYRALRVKLEVEGGRVSTGVFDSISYETRIEELEAENEALRKALARGRKG